MSSKKAKWKESFQKAKSISQTSLPLSSSRKTSVADEETSAKELEQYLETLNRKSGIKGLWSGASFERAVRPEDDKTPEISISSGDDGQLEEMLQSEDEPNSDDFRPNIVMLSRSPSPTSEDQSEVNPMQGIQMAEFALSGDEISDNHLNNSNIGDKLKSLSLEEKDVKSITNDLGQDGEIETEDEVEEEIVEEEIQESIVSEAGGMDRRRRQALKHNRTVTPESHSSDKSVGKNVENSQSHSYTEDFSVASNQTVSEHSTLHSSESRASTLSRKSESQHDSRSSRSSRSYSSRSHSSRSYSSKSHSSWSSRSSRLRSHREHSSHKGKTSGKQNSYSHDVGVQTDTAADTFVPTVPPGLGVGMATSGPRLGMSYVDPSPIATHVIAAEAMEAVTAYNPAIVALNDMLRQQIRLVEQFTESNRRMYEAYTQNLNTSYQYTTLEETMEFIRRHRPKTITMQEALERVKKEDT